MRVLLLLAAITIAPCLALADPQCVLPSPVSNSALAAVPGSVATGTIIAPQPIMQGAEPVPVAPSWSANSSTRVPILDHVAAAGAHFSEAGVSHALRIVVARNQDQFVRLYVTADGQAAVAGLHRLGYSSSVLLRFLLYGARFSI